MFNREALIRAVGLGLAVCSHTLLPIIHLPQVDYDNHPHFKSKQMKGSKRGSPVRIYTNINPADVILPSSEGYRYETILFFFALRCSIFSEQSTSHPNC